MHEELVNGKLAASDLVLWLGVGLVAAVGAFIAIGVLVVWKWKSYSLPMRLLPLDILAVALLFDLNIKSLSNVTVADLGMKVEAIGFMALLAFILFVPVLWKLTHAQGKPRVQ